MKYLSNFSEHDVQYDGYLYPTVEHAFQALKYSCTENPELVNVIREQYKNKTANEAKSSGSKAGMKKMNVSLNLKCWDNKKDAIMRALIQSKVQRHPEILGILTVVRDNGYTLVHHARTDMEWGAHVNYDDEKHITGIKEGVNKLGEIYNIHNIQMSRTPAPAFAAPMTQDFDLIRDGITVVPCPVHFDLQNFLTTQREFVASDSGLAPPALALGAFGCMGTPTSFHHPIIRHVRKQCYDQIFPRFLDWHRGRNLEMMFDRFAQRLPGGTIGGETWHRDVGPHDEGDIIYGGWINLDPPGTPNQRFSCVPGNFLRPDGHTAEGFIRFDAKDEASIAALEAAKQIVQIPPGHIVIFNQSLAHEILPGKIKFLSYRLFMGWRITNSNESIYDYIYRKEVGEKKQKKAKKTENSAPEPRTLANIIATQACPSIGSGQFPPMYGVNHITFTKLKESHLIPFSDTVKPIFRSEKDPRLIVRFLPPLSETGLMWEPYTEEDVNVMLVHPLNARHTPEIVEEENDTIDITKRVKDKLVSPPHSSLSSLTSSLTSSSSSSSKKSKKRKATVTKKRNVILDSSSSEELIPRRTTKRNNVVLDSSSSSSSEELIPRRTTKRNNVILDSSSSSSSSSEELIPVIPRRRTKRNDVILDSSSSSSSSSEELIPRRTLREVIDLTLDSPTSTLKDSPTSTLKDSNLSNTSTSSTLSPIIEMNYKKSKNTKGGIKGRRGTRKKHMN
jgi:ribA/ribD-fused uncharacterized protein